MTKNDIMKDMDKDKDKDMDMDQDIDHDIESLVETMTVKKTLPSFEKRFLLWLVISVFLLIATLAFTGVRGDIYIQMKDPLFYVDLFLKFMLTVIAGYCAFRLSVPGLEKKSTNRLFLFPLVAWILFLVVKMVLSYQLMGAVTFLSDGYFFCSINLIFLTVIPLFIIILMLKRAAPINLYMCGFLAFLACAGIGFMGAKFLCPLETIYHIVIWHFIPFLLISLTGFLAGKYYLKW